MRKKNSKSFSQMNLKKAHLRILLQTGQEKKEKEGKDVNLGHISDADTGLPLSSPH